MEQVGVNAPGTANMATFLPAKRSLVVTGVGFPSCMVCRVASGSFVPVSIAMMSFLYVVKKISPLEADEL